MQPVLLRLKLISLTACFISLVCASAAFAATAAAATAGIPAASAASSAHCWGTAGPQQQRGAAAPPGSPAAARPCTVQASCKQAAHNMRWQFDKAYGMYMFGQGPTGCMCCAAMLSDAASYHTALAARTAATTVECMLPPLLLLQLVFTFHSMVFESLTPLHGSCPVAAVTIK